MGDKRTASGRVPVYDLIRIVAIFFVIILHLRGELSVTMPSMVTYTCETILLTCNSLFFMISGRFIMEKDSDPVPFYWDRLIKIILPVFLATGIYYWASISFEVSLGAAKGIVKSMLLNQGQEYFWFIYSLAGIYLTVPFLQRMVRNLDVRLIRILCIQTIIIFGIFNIMEIKEYNNLFRSYFFYHWLFFFLSGYFLEHMQLSRKIQNALIGIGAIALVINIAEFAIGIDNPSARNYSITFYLICVAFYLFIKNYGAGFAAKCAGPVKLVASTTFMMYILHGVTMDFTRWVFGRLFHLDFSIGQSPLVWIGGSIFTLFITWLLALPLTKLIYEPLTGRLVKLIRFGSRKVSD